MTDATQRPVRRALISVSDKTGIIDFARSLHEQGVEILSTGGTAKLLIEEMIPVMEVSKHTGFPEIMDGRVKTLHPKIHGGILGRRGIDDGVMKDNDMKDRKDKQVNDSQSSRAALLFVAAVVFIGSSSFLPPAFFGDAETGQGGKLENFEGNFASYNRQTGRYLKMPSRF